MPVLLEDGPYTGIGEKLVVGLDIGTDSSAVSLCLLQPGGIPKPRTVSSWPNSPTILKIPSAVLYSKDGRPRAFAAETGDEFVQAQAQDESWKLASWFKLLLHPPTMAPSTRSAPATTSESEDHFETHELPFGVTVEQVYAEYLGYLWKHTQAWFEETTANGDKIWAKLSGTSTIVMSHPDGWNDSQQAVLESALVRAGILTPNESSTRLHFLREAEASVHWSLHYSDTEWLKTGTAFTVVDAGGSTIDTALYVVESTATKLTLRNAKTSDCIQAGGVYWTRAGTNLIVKKLAGSKFGRSPFVEDLTDVFEWKAKRRFIGTESKMIIKFGASGDSNPSVNVVSGRLTLEGKEVDEHCFAPFVVEIIASVERQTRAGDARAKHILLVGRALQDHFEPKGISVVAPDEPTKKAVAEGSVLWFSKQLVTSRAARSTFGIALVYPYNRDNSEHLARDHVYLPDKTIGVRGGWSTVIAKDTVVPISELTTTPYTRLVTEKSQLRSFEVKLYAYGGDETTPHWLLDAYGNLLPNFRQVCTITADLSPLQKILTPHEGAGGVKYWNIDFKLGISFGTNSLSAKVLWSEEGKHCEGPASIVLSALRGSE